MFSSLTEENLNRSIDPRIGFRIPESEINSFDTFMEFGKREALFVEAVRRTHRLLTGIANTVSPITVSPIILSKLVERFRTKGSPYHYEQYIDSTSLSAVVKLLSAC